MRFTNEKTKNITTTEIKIKIVFIGTAALDKFLSKSKRASVIEVLKENPSNLDEKSSGILFKIYFN